MSQSESAANDRTEREANLRQRNRTCPPSERKRTQGTCEGKRSVFPNVRFQDADLPSFAVELRRNVQNGFTKKL